MVEDLVDSQKKRLRRHFIKKRNSMMGHELKSMGIIAQKNLLSLDIFRDSKIISLYSSIKNEMATDLIFLEALRREKIVCFPKIGENCDKLYFMRADRSTIFRPGRYGIMEPEDGDIIKIDDIDVFVIPGVCFDERGFRIGYGKGYFDRTLWGAKGKIIGLAYEFQVLDRIPQKEHDLRVDIIVTEKRVILCK